ncbi:hypothetical protein SAMN05661012_03382 [Chitinophaga sancti]|uniref:Uncharacterized protein n=1 Tax=Chitinophaga sancti TaxID=1004 RepID=A0A1K1R4Y2_9BACT|nr:hypothetical protein SAMN05661012_03382 [Chitinophaga sancti]
METQQKNLLYFRLRLQENINASFPEKANDRFLITEKRNCTI